MSQIFKVLFVGDSITGKTRTLYNLIGKEFIKYEPILGVEVHPYYPGNNSCNSYNIWDCGSGSGTFTRDKYYICGQIAFIFGDETICYEDNLKKMSPLIKVYKNKTVEQIKNILK
jgi:GTPase SAR1 family protein